MFTVQRASLRLQTISASLRLQTIGKHVAVRTASSSSIMSESKANKVPNSLSNTLDSTLKEGHDVKSFGLGTLATMANMDRYAKFLTSLHAVYDTMERAFDEFPDDAVVGRCWSSRGGVLRREGKIRKDLAQAGIAAPRSWAEEDLAFLSGATRNYVRRIEDAKVADGKDGGGRLLGHLYCRYFADLFGGQALKTPTKLALALEPAPTMYDFEFGDGGRAEYIESLYEALNVAGEELGEGGRAAVKVEALECFRLNKELYTEGGIYVDAWRGGVNLAKGAVFSLKPESLKGYGRRKMS